MNCNLESTAVVNLHEKDALLTRKELKQLAQIICPFAAKKI